MPLYIKDDATARLVAELARRRGISKQDTANRARLLYTGDDFAKTDLA